MSKFWKWVKNKTPTDENQASESGRTLFLNGVIDDEKFWGDEVTPREFRDELFSDSGDVTVWINSPGGSVFAADQIYNMLRDYHGKVTVKIDAIAASAASVIAMAGDDVQISPVATMMIHNPSTIALGTADDLAKAIQMLQSIKESILNAYMLKTGMSHKKLSEIPADTGRKLRGHRLCSQCHLPLRHAAGRGYRPHRDLLRCRRHPCRPCFHNRGRSRELHQVP